MSSFRCYVPQSPVSRLDALSINAADTSLLDSLAQCDTNVRRIYLCSIGHPLRLQQPIQIWDIQGDIDGEKVAEQRRRH